MAEDKQQAKTEEPKNTAINGAETTTANDGSLAINQAPETPKQPDTGPSTAAPEAAKTEEATVPAPSQATPAPETPVIVSEADIAAAQKENDPHESLGEQIEVLTGEVQALESKIEKLTSGVGESAAEPPVTKKDGETVLSTPPTEAPKSEEVKPAEVPPPPVEQPAPEQPKPEEAKVQEPIPVTPPPAAAPTAAAIPKSNTSQSAKPVNDIYTKILSGPQGQTPPADHKDLNDEATIEEGTSGIGTIGEVLIVFGLIALLGLLASPFLKSTLGSNWDAIKSIGWPTATISLGLGFILFLFNKGRAMFKIFAFVMLLISAVMLLSVFDYTSMLGPLASFLDPIASFYK
ncbi:MAG: hypothetical protein HZB70_00025 [Candidatus Berkelbacteria bacterium]|nr:MAG: hypothetical protein HZB70_00025 [Candidatus Berkelbacteria bacterium]QQG51499.1 MAG: hypothetical protein HY845_02975 [Candidatus Berkelbacteria bacterium]